MDNPFFENPSSSSFLISFPSSLMNDEELLFEHLLHHHSPPSDNQGHLIAGANPITSPNPNSMNKEGSLLGHVIAGDTKAKPQAGPSPPPPPAKRKRVAGVKKQLGGGGASGGGRRRTGKKDRHSKICTAQGPRDRRMRLSLQIARKFFDLQDMLGFDKASKTIEWLFSKSKSAIRELTASLPPHQRKGSLMVSSASISSTSNSTVGDAKRVGFEHGEGNSDQLRKESKPGYSNPIVKESRERARARARQRTMEKKKQKELMLEINPNSNNNNVSKLGSSSTPESEGSGGYPSNIELNPTLEVMAFNSSQPQKSSVSIIEKLLGSDSSASSSSIYDEGNYMGFAGNWATDTLRMYPSDGAITGVDELQVILQQRKPKRVSSTGSSGMDFHQHCSS